MLERRSPPTFDVLIEIQERDRLAIQPDVAAAVDALVRGYPLEPEIRWRDGSGDIHIEKPAPAPSSRPMSQGTRRNTGNGRDLPARTPVSPSHAYENGEEEEGEPIQRDPVRIYPYGVARNRIIQAARRLGVPVILVRDLEEADVLMTLRSYHRAQEQTIQEAEARRMPMYILRANTIAQVEQMLAQLFNLSSDEGRLQEWDLVSAQTASAIQAVLNGQRWADLPPAPAPIRRMQHEMARQAQLVSHSYGKEPHRRVRIFRE